MIIAKTKKTLNYRWDNGLLPNADGIEDCFEVSFSESTLKINVNNQNLLSLRCGQDALLLVASKHARKGVQNTGIGLGILAYKAF